MHGTLLDNGFVTYGILSLLPSLVAIVLAIMTRRVIGSLIVAVIVGAAILAWNADTPRDGFARFWPVRTLQVAGLSFYESVVDEDHVSVLAFSLLLGAMIGMLEANMSTQRVIGWLTSKVRTRRTGQTMVAGLGLGFFFDDYANTLLLGGSMRPVCKQLRISREKLAYLVDSTAAPVAGLALISTWVATEISLIEKGLPAGFEATAFQVFLYSIPYRFYAIFCLLLVFLVAMTGRDFGPMLQAEAQANSNAKRQADNFGANTGIDRDSTFHLPSLAAVVLPLLVCIAAVLWVLVDSGSRARQATGKTLGGGASGWAETIGSGDSYQALIMGGQAGVLAALLAALMVAPGWKTFRRCILGGMAGAWRIMPAMVVLWFAWSISAMTDEDALNTGGYLGTVLERGLPDWSLPTLVFIVAGFVAFSTGTSWGTMALLTPLAIQLAVRLETDAEGMTFMSGNFIPATVGSVLAGAIWGDHCSPISDTTVLSSRACGCDHIQHVWTQMPYALLAAFVAIGLGTLPAGWGLPFWVSIPAGGLTLWLALVWRGQPASADSIASKEEA